MLLKPLSFLTPLLLKGERFSSSHQARCGPILLPSLTSRLDQAYISCLFWAPPASSSPTRLASLLSLIFLSYQHSQALAVVVGKWENREPNPDGTVYLINTDVHDPFTVFDTYDWRSVIENGLF